MDQILDLTRTWSWCGIWCEYTVYHTKLWKWKQAETSYSPCRHQTVQRENKINRSKDVSEQLHNTEKVAVERKGIGREGRETCHQPATHSVKVLVLLVTSCYEHKHKLWSWSWVPMDILNYHQVKACRNPWLKVQVWAVLLFCSQRNLKLHLSP